MKAVYYYVIAAVCAICIVVCMPSRRDDKNVSIHDVTLGQQIFLHEGHHGPTVRNIDVVLATDEAYAIHCAVTMTSILLNSDSSSYFRFHILDGGISETSKNKILKLRTLRDCSITYHDTSKYNVSMFPNNIKYISRATYYRLMITDILPQHTNKAIYLDCDIIVEQDLKELWNIDINQYMLAAVEEIESVTHSRRLGLPNYFNAGVLLLNMQQLRKFHLLQNSLNYLSANKEKIEQQDQDILNGLLANQCKFIDLKWNVSSHMYVATYEQASHLYSKRNLRRAITHPAVIHFCGKPFHPWIKNSMHPLASEYSKYKQFADKYMEQ